MTINSFAVNCIARVRSIIQTGQAVRVLLALLVGGVFFAWRPYPLLSNYLFISYLGVNSTPAYYAWIAWALAIGSSLFLAGLVFAILSWIVIKLGTTGRQRA